MSALEGFEDLKPKAVIGLDIMTGEVACMGIDGRAMRMQLFVTPQGHLAARHIEPAPIDQVGPRETAQRRHAGVDQM
jgi:hypothetical protein